MIYTSDLLSASDMKKIIQKTDMGVESIDFSVSENLDQLNTRIKEYRSYMEYLGTSSLTLHGPFLDLNPIAFDSKIRAATLYRFSQVYDAGMQLGARKLIFHTGFIPNVHFLEEWSKRMSDFWNSYMENRKEIQILIENVLDPEPEPIKQVKRSVEASNFMLCLDIGHANCYSRVPAEKWIDCFGKDIGHVHVHNNDGVKDSHLALDNGTLCGSDILHAIKSTAPGTSYTIECPAYKDVLKTYTFLKNPMLDPNSL